MGGKIMGVQLHVEKVEESSKDNFFHLKSILEQLEANQLIIEMKAYDAINSSDMLLNIVKEGLHSVDSLLYDEKIGMIRPIEESALNITPKEEIQNRTYPFIEIMNSILEAAYISNQVSRDIEHEIANQGEIIDDIKCKLKNNVMTNK